MRNPDDARRQRVLATIDSIPRGRVATYGGIAAEAGLLGRARYVAQVLRQLPPGHPLPWHRILGAGGHIRTSGQTAIRQARLLRAEGVPVKGGRIDLADHVWP